MSKNNQGYFLVETIIVLAIVATIITTLYVNSGQTYIKHKNELTKIYNTGSKITTNKIPVMIYLFFIPATNNIKIVAIINVIAVP